MSRNSDEKELKRLKNAIEQEQGKQSGFFARQLKWAREKVARGLVSLNDKGVLYYEDDEGGLYPFDPNDL